MTDDTSRGRPRGRTGGDDVVQFEWNDFLEDIVQFEWNDFLDGWPADTDDEVERPVRRR